MKTPQQSHPKLASAIGVPEIYLKREDQHKYGSHKGRSIPLMIKTYHEQGWNNFVISSSGNAALAAILAAQAHNKNKPNDLLSLKVFAGKKIDAEKLKLLMNTASGVHSQKFIANSQLQVTSYKLQVTIIQTDRPKQAAFQIDKEGKAKNLRQSTDDTALLGYHELAQELDKIENLQAIFIPTSSGTTAQGLGETFERLKNKPQIHVIQTESCNPIAITLNVIPAQAGIQESHDADWIPDQAGHDKSGGTRPSIAGAIVDKIAHRKNKVIEIIKNSRGSGWIVSDDEIKGAMKLVKQTTGIEISPNSAISIAGLKKAVESGYRFNGPIVCLVTGK
ncbi:MAG: PLP-dependent lyase/thiolase [Patescibacteria group bacterium]